jgi:N-acetylglutamate synthase-like GNAT family acetyltransferase
VRGVSLAGLEIRPARIADATALVVIDHEAHRRFLDTEFPNLADDGIPEAVALRYIGRGGVLVAERQGEVVGFVAWHYEPADVTCMGIAQVSVLPEHGGLGIGSALTTAVLALADQESQIEKVVLATQRGVPWNEPWYVRLGFVTVDATRYSPWMAQEVAEQEASGFSWTDRVWMARPTAPRIAVRT